MITRMERVGTALAVGYGHLGDGNLHLNISSPVGPGHSFLFSSI